MTNVITNEAEAQTLKAMEQLRQANYAQAAALLSDAAEAGHPIAANQLGALLEHGYGVEQNPEKALHFYEIAARSNMALAQFNVGFMHHMGKGVPEDFVKAHHWYSLAAKQDEPTALLNLGILTARGQGVPKNSNAGYKLWVKAARRGEAMAAFNLGMVHAGGHDTDVDFVRGCYWFECAFKMGHQGAGPEVQKLRRLMNDTEIAEVDAVHAEARAQSGATQ